MKVIKKNKNPPKESRQRDYSQFFLGKIWIEWEKVYQFYTKENGEKKS